MFKNSVGRPSNETIRKRRIIKALALSIVFIAILSITYTLTNINTKRLKGDSGPDYYGISCAEGTACYQAGFRNGNLYQRVIDSYNDENNASLSYEDVITDEQFLAITRVYADEGSIDDATGIEKLINLKTLYLPDNNLTSIDLSSLTKLETLQLSGNNLSEVDVSNLVNLSNLNLSYNNINEIDVSNLILLDKLYLGSNNISSINVNGLTRLNDLSLFRNNLVTINISDLILLEELYLSSNNLSEIDLSNNTKLENLSLSNNEISEIDVSSLTQLRSLNLNGNKLITIDVSENTNLEDLDLSNNKLNTIDLSRNLYLYYLSIDGNQLTSLNLNNNTNIYNLSLDLDLYDSIDFDNYEELNLSNTFQLFKGDKININKVLDKFDIESIYISGNAISFNKGDITAIKEGGVGIDISFGNGVRYYASILVLDRITSNKYDINYDDKYLYVGSDDEETIKNNLSIDNKLFLYGYCHLEENYNEDELNLCLDEMAILKQKYKYKIKNDKLKVITFLYDDDIRPMIYTLGRIDLSSHEVNDKTITAASFDVNDIESYNVFLEYSDNTLIVKDLNGNEVDRYTVVSNNDPGTIDPEPIDQGDNNGDPAPNNNDNNTTSSKKTTLNKFENNAKTYDDIVKYFIIGGISVILIVSIIIYKGKKK